MDEEAAALNAALQALKQTIVGIVEGTSFDGDAILAGGDGPDGAYRIALPPTGATGQPAEILIPSARSLIEADDNPDRFGQWKSPEAVVPRLQRLAETIVAQRGALQQTYATIGFDPDQRLSEQTGPVAPLEHLQIAARSVSETVLSGRGAPFQAATHRMRAVLELASRAAFAPATEAAAPQAATTVGDAAPARSGAAAAEKGNSRPDNRRSEIARLAPDGTVSAEPHPESSHAPLRGTPVTDTPERAGRTNGGKAQGDEALADSGPERPVDKGATRPAGEGTPAAVPATLPLGAAGPSGQDVVLPANEIDAQPDLQFRPVSGGIDPEPPAGSSEAARQGVAPAPSPAASTADAGDRAEDTAGAFLAAALEQAQPRSHGGTDTRQPETVRPVETDALRRAPGAVQPSRDPDLRLDAGLSVARPGGDESADAVEGYGASLPAEPGGFLAELVRADGMLHVADLAIEQIDLHLDYLRELAEEAATVTGRGARALDDMFQAVKVDVVDALARTTEAQGEKLLAGGDGPDDHYVIRLAGGGNDVTEIAVRSMRLDRLSPELVDADIRTRDAAIAALGLIDIASDDALQARDTIADQRALLRQLISQEVARTAGLRRAT